jgi:hypothetical protein
MRLKNCNILPRRSGSHGELRHHADEQVASISRHNPHVARHNSRANHSVQSCRFLLHATFAVIGQRNYESNF